MSIRMRLPATHEIRISHFPVLSLPQESGNAQAHYNMVALEWRPINFTILMVFDNRIAELQATSLPACRDRGDRIAELQATSLPACRDRGWMMWKGGGLVPVPLVRVRSACPTKARTKQVVTRTGTRPPPFLSSTPCPYRIAFSASSCSHNSLSLTACSLSLFCIQRRKRTLMMIM